MMTVKELRKFGYTGTAFFGVLWLLASWTKGSPDLFLGGMTALFFLPALVHPPLLKPVHRLFTVLGHYMGLAVNTVILSLLYFTLFTLIRFVYRLIGKRFIETRFDRKAATYWTDMSEHEDDNLKQQF